MTLANRRNSELHSGLVPFEGINIEAWMPKFWDVCKMLLDFQGNSLSDFVDENEASTAEAIIIDHSKSLQNIIELRINRHKLIYFKKYSQHSPQSIKFDFDSWEEVIECPSCENGGIAEGELFDSEFDRHDPDEPWIIYINEHYDVTSFRCLHCDLKLNGYDEVKFSGI